jgi:hypothetical protein
MHACFKSRRRKQTKYKNEKPNDNDVVGKQTCDDSDDNKEEG